jgi:predicted GIY-YIG superfamily endonuclease
MKNICVQLVAARVYMDTVSAMRKEFKKLNRTDQLEYCQKHYNDEVFKGNRTAESLFTLLSS